MKYSWKKKIAAAMVASMMLLTSGCGVSVNNRYNGPLQVDGAVDPEEKVSDKAIDLEFFDLDDDLTVDIKKNISIDAKDIKRLVSQSYLGEVYVHPSASNEIEVQFFVAYSKELTGKEKEFWEKTSLNLLQKNDVLYIEPNFPKNIYKNFQIFSNRNDQTLRVVGLDIGVPKHIQELGLSNSVGYMKIEDIQVKLRLMNNVGAVEMSGFTPIESAHITNNVGSIEYSVSDLSQVYEIVNITNVGAIDCVVKDEDTVYERIEINSFNEKIYRIFSDRPTSKEEVEFDESRLDQIEDDVTESLTNPSKIFEEWESAKKTDRPSFIIKSNVGAVSVE